MKTSFLKDMQSGWRTGRTTTLVRHFVLRLTSNDFLKFENQRQEGFVIYLTLLAVIGAVFAHKLYFPYLISGFTDVVSSDLWKEKVYFNVLTMAVTGIISVVNWEQMFLDRRDFVNLSVQPVKTAFLFLCKCLALFTFVAIISFAYNALFAPVYSTYLANRFSIDPFSNGLTWLLWNFMANLFVFLLVALIQNFLMLLFKNRFYRRAATLIQSLLLIGFISLFFWFPVKIYPGLPQMKLQSAPFLKFFPPLWFAGAQERMMGSSDPFFAAHAGLVLILLAALCLLYLAGLPLSVRRHLVQPGNGFHPARSIRLWLACRFRFFVILFQSLFLKNRVQQAVFYFSLKTFRRSRQHRLQFVIYAALFFGFVGTEIVLLFLSRGTAYFTRISGFLVSLPFWASFCLILGWRMAIARPFRLEANWLFKLTDTGSTIDYLRGLKKAVLFFSLLPLLAGLFFVYLLLWGLPLAAEITLFAAVQQLIMLEILFFNYAKIPFACEYLPGKLKLKTRWPFYLISFLTVYGSFEMLGLWLIGNPVYFPLYLLCGMALVWLLKRRNERHANGLGITFEEEAEPVMLSLGLD